MAGKYLCQIGCCLLVCVVLALASELESTTKYPHENETFYAPCGVRIEVEKDKKYYFKSYPYGEGTDKKGHYNVKRDTLAEDHDELKLKQLEFHDDTDYFQRARRYSSKSKQETCILNFVKKDNCRLVAHFNYWYPGEQSCNRQHIILTDEEYAYQICAYHGFPREYESTTDALYINFFRKMGVRLHVFKGYVICHSNQYSDPNEGAPVYKPSESSEETTRGSSYASAPRQDSGKGYYGPSRYPAHGVGAYNPMLPYGSYGMGPSRSFYGHRHSTSTGSTTVSTTGSTSTSETTTRATSTSSDSESTQYGSSSSSSSPSYTTTTTTTEPSTTDSTTKKSSMPTTPHHHSLGAYGSAYGPSMYYAPLLPAYGYYGYPYGYPGNYYSGKSAKTRPCGGCSAKTHGSVDGQKNSYSGNMPPYAGGNHHMYPHIFHNYYSDDSKERSREHGGGYNHSPELPIFPRGSYDEVAAYNAYAEGEDKIPVKVHGSGYAKL